MKKAIIIVVGVVTVVFLRIILWGPVLISKHINSGMVSTNYSNIVYAKDFESCEDLSGKKEVVFLNKGNYEGFLFFKVENNLLNTFSKDSTKEFGADEQFLLKTNYRQLSVKYSLKRLDGTIIIEKVITLDNLNFMDLRIPRTSYEDKVDSFPMDELYSLEDIKKDPRKGRDYVQLSLFRTAIPQSLSIEVPYIFEYTVKGLKNKERCDIRIRILHHPLDL